MSIATWYKQLTQGKMDFARGLTREFVLFSASTVACQFSRLAISLIVARWAGPEEFGSWNVLNLILIYGFLVTLGVPIGMNRNVPLLMGQGDKISAQQATNTSLWFVLFSNMITGLVISVIGITQQYHKSFICMGILFPSWWVYQFFQLLLKCNFRFNLLSLQQLAYAILLPVVVLPLVYVWRISGFVIGQAVLAILLSILISQMASFKITLSWSWRSFLHLVKVGLPLMIVALLYNLLTSVDRWVILRFLGVEALGHYTVAILCFGSLSLLPAVISQQMYPRMAFRFGQTQDPRSLLPLVIQQSVAEIIVTIPILATAYLFLPFLVNHLLAKYAPGVTPARILLLGLAFIPLADGIANFLCTVGKQMYYLAVQSVAVGVNLALDVFLVKAGLGLKGIAMGAAITYVFYVVALIMIYLWIITRTSNGGRIDPAMGFD